MFLIVYRNFDNSIVRNKRNKGMLNEKSKLSKPINLLFVLFAILSLNCTGCLLKDNISVNGFWEEGLGDTTRLTKLYYIDKYQQGDFKKNSE